jgi:murein DD-endopeptidase MepM/ murein hydrolase activator NlpD
MTPSDWSQRHRQRQRGSAARATWHQQHGKSISATPAAPSILPFSLLPKIEATFATLLADWRGAGLSGMLSNMPLRMALHAAVVVLACMVIAGDSLLSWSRQAASPAPTVADMLQHDAAAAAPQVVPFAGAFSHSAPILVADGGEHAHLLAMAPPVRAPVFEAIPAFHEQPHSLIHGETLGDLAARYGVSIEALVWANNLQHGDALAIGQELRIPLLPGVPYVIREGDNLDAIAARFGVPAEHIAAFVSNDVALDKPLPVGQEIFIPEGTPPLPPALLATYGGEQGIAAMAARPTGIVREHETIMREGPDTVYAPVIRSAAGRQVALLAQHDNWLQVELAGVTGWMRADMLDAAPQMVDMLPVSNDFPPPPPVWVWPTYGALTSGFGPRWGGFHNGIDIANNAWTPIFAARTGIVTEAGWCSGYGYCVKMRHDDGIGTIYGHLVTQPTVSAGEHVTVGETIGYMGSTYDVSGGGYSTGNHLHFTITVNGRAVNPFVFLP